MGQRSVLIQKFLESMGLSRRNFLKSTTALGAVGLLSGCSKSDDGSIIYQTTPIDGGTVEETLKPAVCRPNCFSSCYLNAHVRDNKIVKISRRPLPNRDYDRVCLRGLSQAQRVYSSDRLLHPLKRKNSSSRGNPEWEQISWTDAIKYIADNLKAIRNDAGLGNRSVAHLVGTANYAAIQKAGMSKFFNIIDATNIIPQVDRCQSVGMSRALGVSVVYPYMQANEPVDFRNAKTVVAWGSNVAEAQIQNWHFIADAITQNDAKLISVDVMLSSTASRANHFIHLTPGTDTLLALSVINEIIENHSTRGAADCWVDYDFMEKNTIAPFLIKPAIATNPAASPSDPIGKYLRYSDLTAAQQSGISLTAGLRTVEADALIAHDGINFYATRHDTDLLNKPMLTAAITCEYNSVTWDGVQYSTAFGLLKDRAAQYPAAATQATTGVHPDVVKKFAEIYCTNGPASIITGFGPDHYTNGHHVYHALATLAAITGQMGKAGASVGMYIQATSSNTAELSARPAELGAAASPGIAYPIMATVFNVDGASVPTAQGNGGPNELFRGTPTKIRALWCSWGNPMTTFVDPASLAKMLTTKDGSEYRIKLAVSVDTAITDTGQYCDLVLPVSHWFEQDDVVSNSNHPHYLYAPRAVEPLGECKSDGEIAKLLAEEMGYGKYFRSTFEHDADTMVSAETYRTFYKGISGKDLAPENNVSWDKLKQEGAIRNFPGTPSKPYIYPMHRKATASGCDSMVFGTQTAYISGNTKRIEFYAENIYANSNYGQASGGSFFFETDIDMGKERLPDWEAPGESIPGNSEYPFQLISERQRWRAHSQWNNTPWLREFDPYPTVKISKEDAASMNIKDGDLVKVSNARGHCVVKAIVSVGIRKGMVNVPRGWQMSQFKTMFGEEFSGDLGNSQLLTSRKVHPVPVVQSFYDACVKLEKI